MSPTLAERPHILLIISDDHGYADLSSRGSADARTPHLDRLAASGMSFDSAYVTAPICSPSRAGLIAGAHQQRWGGHWFSDASFPPEQQPVLPELLGEGGYRTGYFGKVHYGFEQPGDRACPERHGFDSSFYGMTSTSAGRLHYLHHSRASRERLGDEFHAVHGVNPMFENGRETDCERHLTSEFAQRAIDFMGPAPEAAADGAPAEDPFFCMVAFNAVHNFAWQLPEDELAVRALPSHDDFDPDTDKYIDWYDGAISPHLENGRGYYLAQLEIMDREIGRMLDHLEATGRREHTLVVYLTDNGGSACNYGINAPLHGTKYSLFEGGVRVPLMVSWPGRIQPGSRSDVLISSMDLLPTFLAAAGLRPPRPEQIDGRPLQDCWEGDGTGHELLHFDTGFQWAVRDREWKLRWVDEEDTTYRDRLLRNEHTDIGAGLTLVPIGTDLDESPQADVADQHPEVVAALLEAHRDWSARMRSHASA
ncbi:arylsulfatase [Brachybacterium vulturis]|uniref:Arylsulfatase n=1 Tax=Brachybacterium vulturis TaxID=2017484 RepID=A0A291GJ93_9MICO|nr:sulfatase-like hydrolase/transferase [Brachybacterium vulturis]ATG50419.1 arylsulfatase [Brachybacterium vulturis]